MMAAKDLAHLNIEQLREIALRFRLRELRGQPNAGAIADAMDSVVRQRHAAIAERVRKPVRRMSFSIR